MRYNLQKWKCCECLELIQKEIYILQCKHCICAECYKNATRDVCIVCGSKVSLYERGYLCGIIEENVIKFVG